MVSNLDGIPKQQDGLEQWLEDVRIVSVLLDHLIQCAQLQLRGCQFKVLLEDLMTNCALLDHSKGQEDSMSDHLFISGSRLRENLAESRGVKND